MRWTLGKSAVRLAAAVVAGPVVSLALLPAALAQTSPPVDTLSDLQRLGQYVGSASLPVTDREQAARRLVDRHSQAARHILLDLLNNAGDPVGQEAVAHAIANDPHPDPAYVGPLRSLLGSSRALTSAAATALVNYRSDPDSFPQLMNVASNQARPDGVRTGAIRAMGALIDKRVAAFLMQILTNSNESVPVQNAAADALGDITGLHENGIDRQRWQQWWAINQNKPEDQWRADLLYDRAREFDQIKRRYTQLANGLTSILRDNYALVPEANKSAVLLKYLKSDEAEVRATGADIIDQDLLGKHIDDDLKDRLRGMVGDSDRSVRAAVANTLFDINDRGAVPAVITQLGQEPDPQIRVKLANSLGRMDDLRAVPVLLKMLNDPYFQDATAAALALGELGPHLHRDNPTLASQVVDALQQVLDVRTGDAAAAGLRAACVAAMATLQDPRAMRTFLDMLKPGEPNDVHRAALRGLGNLDDPNADEAIAGSLSDPDPGVRLEAARALKNVASFAQAEQLYRMLDPNEERDPEVRDAVWQALRRLLHTGTVQQLNGWPDRFRNDLDKQLEALIALREALAKTGDGLQLAYTDQNVGAALMKLTPPRADEAVDAFQKALDYWRGPGANQAGGSMALDDLVGQMLKALLAAKRYPAAASFAAQQIAINDQFQEIVGPRLRDEADQLHAKNQDPLALQLIAECLKMSPPLDTRYQGVLQQLRDEIKQNPSTP